MKKLLFSGFATAAALLLGPTAQAQVSFGPRVGLNLSTLSYDFNGEDEPSSKVQYGAQFGLSMNVQFDKFSVQPSFLFSMKGDKAESTGTETYLSGGQTITSSYEYKRSFRLNYLELPINLVYSTNGADGGFQVFAGPYVAMGLNGKAEADTKETTVMGAVTRTEISSDKVDVNFVSKQGTQDKAYIRPFDAGFNLGVGYKAGGIQAQVGYALGLGNLTVDDIDGNKPDISVRNRGFQLSLAYFFTK